MNDSDQCCLTNFDELYEVVSYVIKRGNYKEIAKKLGRSPIYVSLWGSHPDNRHGIPGDKVVPFCIAASNSKPIEWMASQVGLGTFKIPDVEYNISDHSVEMSRVAKEFSDVLREFSKSIKDNHLSKDEKKKIEKQAEELGIEALRFVALLRRSDG